MKIGIISSVALKTPPTNYGGLEWICYLLAKGLEELNHEVTLIAAKGSQAPKGVQLIETIEASRLVGKEKEAYELYKDKLTEFDIVHDHSWRKISYVHKMEHPKLNLISTTHSQCPYRTAPPIKFPCMCGVSKAHAIHMSALLGVPVRGVPNGIDLSIYPLQTEKGDRYLFLNRVMREKGAHVFVDLCRKLRVKGDLAGEDIKLIPDPSYVMRVQNLCDGYLVRYWGSVSNERKLELLQNAKATIGLPFGGYFEVFGLYVTESLACGTPVIALRNGGITEQIQYGKTGFLCNSPDEIEKVINGDKVSKIKPEDCRKQAERFSYQKMSKKYLSLYEDIVLRDKLW